MQKSCQFLFFTEQILPAIPTTIMMTGFFLKLDDGPPIFSCSIVLDMLSASLPFQTKKLITRHLMSIKSGIYENQIKNSQTRYLLVYPLMQNFRVLLSRSPFLLTLSDSDLKLTETFLK